MTGLAVNRVLHWLRSGWRVHLVWRNPKRWKCGGCKKQFSVKVGTIFPRLAARSGQMVWSLMWLIANNVAMAYPATNLAALSASRRRVHGICSTASATLYDRRESRIRWAAAVRVRVDETIYRRAGAKNMHKSKRIEGFSYAAGKGSKAVVLGMLERGGKVRAEVD